MKTILFYDSTARSSYSENSLSQKDNGIGGTEATVIHVALGLSKIFKVIVSQYARELEDKEKSSGVEWISAKSINEEAINPDFVIVLRRISDCVKLRKIYKNSRILIWYHDWYPPSRSAKNIKLRILSYLKSYYRLLIHRIYDVDVVTVSNFHKSNLLSLFHEAVLLKPLVKKINITYIYNPVVVSHNSTKSEVNNNQLIFFSGASKGIDQVLSAFSYLNKYSPNMKLLVASPGYESKTAPQANVNFLGNLTHRDLFSYVAGSLCVFYPANLVPETFGLVFAESHALGTPVLAHDFGAASELLSKEELIDATNLEMVTRTIKSWQQGARPIVRTDTRFSLENVTRNWIEFLYTSEESIKSHRRL